MSTDFKKLYDQISFDLIECQNVPDQLTCDPWIASSLLQKAIRRGDVLHAQRAAVTLLQHRGAALWRRLLIIAAEDIGVASDYAIFLSAIACTDRQWRRVIGTDASVAVLVATVLAKSAKSRSAEHLITVATHHPAFAHIRLCENPIDRLRQTFHNQCNLDQLIGCAFAISICLRSLSRRAAEADTELSSISEVFRLNQVQADVIRASQVMALRTREPMALLLPLLWSVAQRSQKEVVPPPGSFHHLRNVEMPLYALDKHTLIGRTAIRRWVRENRIVKRFLVQAVAPSKVSEAAYMAAFYADAVAQDRQYRWQGCDELENLGTAADLLKSGVRADCVDELIQIARDHLPHLNVIRSDLWNRARMTSAIPAGGTLELAEW